MPAKLLVIGSKGVLILVIYSCVAKKQQAVNIADPRGSECKLINPTPWHAWRDKIRRINYWFG